METNIAKCFICDVECDADEKFLGTNIARTLTTPMSTVLAKCLRSIVDTESEYFCSECTRKIEEYDQMVQLSLQIETELYELFRKKPLESCYLLDAEIITDPIAINSGEQIISTAELKLEGGRPHKPPENDLTESYDEMVVEYLDEYEAQSNNDNDNENDNDDELLHTNDIEENAGNDSMADQLELSENDAETKVIKIEQKSPARRGRKPKKKAFGVKGVASKTKAPTKRTEKQPNDENDLTCKQCPFTANSQEEFAEHKATEHYKENGKRLTCDVCGRTYKSKSALSVHLAMHKGRSPHECEMCGKTFTQRGALVRHMPMHTGERPHQCEVCGKRFVHYSSFHMHQMIHTNEKKKKCHICGQEFRSNSHITRHVRTHTGEKPYACPICGQKFAQRYNMKTHYNTHQGIHRPQSRNHKCILCMEAFPRREKLNKHLRQDHGVSDEDIKILAEKGPDSEEAVKILQRLKSSVQTKQEEGEVFIEYVEEGGDDDGGDDIDNGDDDSNNDTEFIIP